MDGVDPIQPLLLTTNPGHLHVASTNKDGRHKSDEEAHEQPHDVLELHDEEIDLEAEPVLESSDEPVIGLDIAV